MTLAQPITTVASEEGVDVPTLERSAARTADELANFRQSLADSFPEIAAEMTVVLTGSFARAEVTAESDCDFLVLVDQIDDPGAVPAMVQEMRGLAEEFNFDLPGAQGVFGDFALTQELVARIGLDADSNTNLTRRMLLLFESVSVYGDETRDEAINLLLSRYCYDYNPEIRTKEEPPATARFLLNDLTRYWHTMTVDFGAKQWRTARRDWYLRYAKLLTTRKILFAGSLASLFTVSQARKGSTDPRRTRRCFPT